jgi:hypothetical protein
MKTIPNINIIFTNSISFSQSNKVSVVSNDKGMKLVVDGKDFMINGMKDYYPIGTNYTYSLWNQSDDVIKALDSEMGLLKTWGLM